MFEPDTIVGRHYRIVSQLGAGGMSQVYKAVDVNLGREVALKFLHPESVSEKDLVQRFLNEGRILATIKHRAVIDVYASDTDEATKSPFLVMELVDGLTLEAAEHTLRGDLPRLLQLFIELLEGIHACHQKGIIHRDLKPANVLINRSGQLKIVDFGVAKTVRKVTRTGVTLGTPHYMAPEQCLGKSEISSAADIYSIGIMFWEMLVGKVPFDVEAGATDPALTIALKHLNEPVPLDSINGDPRTAPFADLLRDMLAKKPEDRPAVPDIIETLKKRIAAPAPGAATTEADPAMIGDIYRLDRVLGQGGMGTVYKALDTALNRAVAIKVLNASISADESVVDRFIKEGRLLATVGHPNVLAIYASSRDKATGRPFLVMEYIDGMLLSDIKKSGAPDHKRIVPLILQLMDGIRACHQKGIVHRDLKPTNLMVTRDGTLKIFDFGIAKTEAAMTRVGMTLGTPQYMSPEQCTGSSTLTPASDIYSIGIVLWELIFGTLPFTAEHDSNPELAIALKQVQGTLPMPSLPADPALASLVPMVRRMLDKQATERPTTDEIIAFLDEHLHTYPVEGVRMDLTKRRDSLRRSTAEGLFDEAASVSSRKKLIFATIFLILLGGILALRFSSKPGAGKPADESTELIASLTRRIADEMAAGQLTEAVMHFDLLASIPAALAQTNVYRSLLCDAMLNRTRELRENGEATAALDLLALALRVDPANLSARSALEMSSASEASSPSVIASETPLPPVEPAVVPSPPTVEIAALPPQASDTAAVTPAATEIASAASEAVFVQPDPASMPIAALPASAAPPVEVPVPPPVTTPPQSSLESHFEAVRREIDEFTGVEDPAKIIGKLDALGTLAGLDQVLPLKRQLASKIALTGDLKLATDKAAAVAVYEQALAIDPDQPATKAKLSLARAALESEKSASTKKTQQDKLKDRAALAAAAEKDAKAFKPGFSAPKPLIGKLKSLDSAGEIERARALTSEIKEKYFKAAGARSEKDPHGALRLLKQLTGFPGMKNDQEVKSRIAEFAEKAKAAGPEIAAAPETKPEKPVSEEETGTSSDEGEPAPADHAPVMVTPTETGSLLSQITQPEVVSHNVDKIIQLCKELEKKRHKDEAAAYRLQAVENLIDNAEENSANGAFDAAIVDYNKALKILPKHPGALAGRQVIQNLSKKGGASSQGPSDAPPEPYIDAEPDENPNDAGR